MSRLLFSLLCLAWMPLSFAGGVERGQNDAVILQAVDELMSSRKVPGVAVAFYDGHKGSVYTFGVMDKAKNRAVTANTIFEIASITKVFTSTELALLSQRGSLSLADPVIKFFPALRDFHGPISHVTLLHLATHTSGFPRAPISRGPLIQALREWQPLTPAGTHYLYSNFAYGLLGLCLAKSEGKHYQGMIRDDILVPLGMNRTEVIVPQSLMSDYAEGYLPNGGIAKKWPMTAWPGGGAIRSTANDMLAFLEANLQVRGPKELTDAMQLAQKGVFEVNEHLTLGLGWQRFKRDSFFVIDKNGGLPGFSSYIGMLPEKKNRDCPFGQPIENSAYCCWAPDFKAAGSNSTVNFAGPGCSAGR